MERYHLNTRVLITQRESSSIGKLLEGRVWGSTTLMHQKSVGSNTVWVQVPPRLPNMGEYA